MKALFILCLLLSTFFSPAQKAKNPPTDSIQIRNLITGFYKWYNTNWQKLNAIKLYKSKNKKETPPYVIDWKEVERYFTFLRKNAPELSEEFFENERQRLKISEEQFKKYPEEELPAGFDYDRFTDSQEGPSYFLKELNKKTNKWIITFVGDKTYVVIQTKGKQPQVFNSFFCGRMTKVEGKWKITRLDCDLTTDEPIESKELQ